MKKYENIRQFDKYAWRHQKEIMRKNDPDYIIYTDGSCLRNPGGAGGWAAIIKDMRKNETKEISGGEESTTNNRMEMLAVLKAIKEVDNDEKPVHIRMFTDSQYVWKTITKQWIAIWKACCWVTLSRTPVKNKDLWKQIDYYCAKHKVDIRWVKGHNGNSDNERCDELARIEAVNHITENSVIRRIRKRF